MSYQKDGSLSFLWKLLAVLALVFCFHKMGYCQTVPPYQSHNFQYLTGVLTPSQKTSVYTANAFNSAYPPKYYTLSVTTTASGFDVILEGSLDNSNWAWIAETTSAVGATQSKIPFPMLYFRMRADSIGAGTSVTATAIGSP